MKGEFDQWNDMLEGRTHPIRGYVVALYGFGYTTDELVDAVVEIRLPGSAAGLELPAQR